jgi:hypothetical protein
MFTSLLSSPRRRGRTGGVKIRRMPVLFVRREDGTVVAARRRVGSAAAAIGEWLPGGGGSTAARLPDAGGDTIKSVSLFWRWLSRLCNGIVLAWPMLLLLIWLPLLLLVRKSVAAIVAIDDAVLEARDGGALTFIAT